MAENSVYRFKLRTDRKNEINHRYLFTAYPTFCCEKHLFLFAWIFDTWHGGTQIEFSIELVRNKRICFHPNPKTYRSNTTYELYCWSSWLSLACKASAVGFWSVPLRYDKMYFDMDVISWCAALSSSVSLSNSCVWKRERKEPEKYFFVVTKNQNRI